jgi:hypothetical protein
MTRRGFALVAVLWLLAAVSALAGGAIEVAGAGRLEAINRLTLTRGRWASEACEAILRARFAADQRAAGLDSVDLGRGTWCLAWMEDSVTRVDSDSAGPTGLRRDSATRRMILRVSGGVKGYAAVWHTSIEVAPSGPRLAVHWRALQ